MKKKIALILYVSILFQIGCSDDDIANFDGITETNEFAVITGGIDESDWNLDENWSNQEASLFNELSLEELNNNGNDVAFSNFNITPNLDPAYPNPSRGLVRFSSINIDFDEGKLILVNNRYNTIAGPVNLRPGSDIQFQIVVRNLTASFFQTTGSTGSSPTVNSGQVVRAYYYFKINDQDVFLKGHGDILFE